MMLQAYIPVGLCSNPVTSSTTIDLMFHGDMLMSGCRMSNADPTPVGLVGLPSAPFAKNSHCKK
jgi:hypothetical protein